MLQRVVSLKPRCWLQLLYMRAPTTVLDHSKPMRLTPKAVAVAVTEAAVVVVVVVMEVVVVGGGVEAKEVCSSMASL